MAVYMVWRQRDYNVSFPAVSKRIAINIGGSLFYNTGAGDGTRPVHGCMEINE